MNNIHTTKLLSIASFFTLIVFAFCNTALATADKNNYQHDNMVPYVLTISGGISLGAYEAGLNWALLNYLKLSKQQFVDQTAMQVYPKLATVTGASAGSINGLISVISWCVDNKKVSDKSAFRDTLQQNLFRDIWVDVGLDELLPGDESKYLKNDGVLSRSAFNIQLIKIRTILSESIFEPGCEVPFGLTVTGEQPRMIDIGGIIVNNQRYFIPMRFAIDANGHAGFYAQHVDYAQPNFGNVIYLPPNDETDLASNSDSLSYKLKNDDVIQAVLTSAAFPVAFGRIELKYCSPFAPVGDESNSKDTIADHLCPKALYPRKGVFIDGGVFDNVPLGSAKALAESIFKKHQRRMNYIFMDPGNRRNLADGAHPEPKVITTQKENSAPNQSVASDQLIQYDLVNQIKFLGGAVGTARNYELYKVLTNGDWTNQTFSFVKELNRHLNAALSDQQTASSEQPQKSCNELFQEARFVKPKVTNSWIMTARRCVEQESALLDTTYQFIAKDPQSLSQQRQTLINHIYVVARGIGQDVFAKRVESAQYDELGDRRILLSSRFFPLTGDYLFAFGAFFDRPFREIDYYVGVYDAIHDLASYSCQFRLQQSQPGKDQRVCQTGERAQQIFQQLGLNKDSTAKYLFLNIAHLEHISKTEKDADWNWVDQHALIDADKNTQILFNALNNEFDKDQVLQPPPFNEFIKLLAENNYGGEDASEYYTAITKSSDDNWWILPTVRIIDRLATLERQSVEEAHIKSRLLKPLTFASDAVNYYSDNGSLFGFRQPTRHEQWWWQYFPYEIGIDALHENTPFISWQPTLTFLGRPVLGIKITPWQREFDSSDSDELYQVSAIYIFNRESKCEGENTSKLCFLWRNTQFGAAFDLNGRYQKREQYDRATAGFSINAHIKKALRVTLGIRDFHDNLARHNIYLNVGITDLGQLFH